ncbi:MAG: precorrin-6y C5,15-methyltransferase (decarboxylating) subunit CbiE [Planctomycetota bacterium]
MSSQDNQVHILGVGDDGLEGLTTAAGSILKSADLIIGPERSLALIGQSPARKFVTHGDPGQIAEIVSSHPKARIVILADGDPLFYGTARFLCDRLGKDRVEVVPHVSSMQLAFARVKEQWDEAYLTNLANQDLDRAIERIRSAERVGIFTTERVSPPVVARTLLDRGINYFTGYVCENLGSPDERVTHAELPEIAKQLFSALNVMILVRKPGMPDRPREMVDHRLFGNPDEAFLQSRPKRGLLTPAEVRCIALAEMDLGPSSIVWDVGAGSGAVSVEAALLAPGGHIYAIEMDAEDYQLITANADRFSVTNLVPVLGQAPDAWGTLPDPDAVFVGGAGRQVWQIVEQAFARLRPGGRIVTNVVSIENVKDVQHGIRQLAGESNIWMINIARGTQQLETTRFDSTPPTFLIGARKPQP